MRLLLDTHTLLWWLDGDRRMSKRARTLVGRGAQAGAVLLTTGA